ncbi:MAG: hydrogenase accessory protein HypB [Candidatus Lokiarchaeota archaeon]|nr:hydrogenase accessory protein HypB [Candidatus Lokiarchaeota archaeon]
MTEWQNFVNVEEDLIAANVKLAKENEEIFNKRDLMVYEIMGNIGSGKTKIIGKLVEHLKDKYKIFVINGDCATDIDAERIKSHGAETIQINTGKECHLDAFTIRPVFNKIPKDVNLCFIEQVGNMICPADFPLGAKHRTVVFEITNGPYIVRKHPFIFAITNIVFINKVDIAEYVDMDKPARDKLKEDINKINKNVKVIFGSAKTGEGIEELISAMDL